MSNIDQAHQNSEYVRRLLKKKWPEFAADLERVVWELTCPCDAPSAESPTLLGKHPSGKELAEFSRSSSRLATPSAWSASAVGR